MKLIKYSLVGIYFGIVLTKANVISWFRIQEMFLFESFHMYGVIGSAIFVGLISIQILKRFKIKSYTQKTINPEQKEFTKGTIFGSVFFGFGWGIIGACPGPIYILIGTGYSTMILTLFFALTGVWFYGKFQHKLPH